MNPEGPHGFHGVMLTVLRGFISVELNDIQPACVQRLGNIFTRGVDENPHLGDAGR